MSYRSISRRHFLCNSTASVTLLALQGQGKAVGNQPARNFEHGSPLAEFGYDAIQFAPGPHQAQLEQAHETLMALDEDSLLRPFRLAAGLRAPGEDLGGLYSVQWPGHTFGQWVSALSRHYEIFGNAAIKDKVNRLVSGFEAAIEPTGKIYAARDEDPKSKSFDPSMPAYRYDKIACGMVDAEKFAHEKNGLDILLRTTRAAASRLPGKALDRSGYLEGDISESYTLPENQFLAWQRGGSDYHLDMAQRYLHDAYFDSLARGVDVLPGRHAYSHVNALCSAAKAYLVLGDLKYLQAAINGFRFVSQQSFATGGWGPDEAFIPSPASVHSATGIKSLGDSIRAGHSVCETPCGAYAHFKLTRYLTRITKDSRYGDSMERVMYNTVLGALPAARDGRTFYGASLSAQARKQYAEGMRWGCCTGSLPQIAADYRISSYFHDEEGIFVNLYIPSTLRESQGGAQIALTQTSQYPLSDRIAFTIETSRPADFMIRFRIPAWARQPSLSVNGQRGVEDVRPGSFAGIRRRWRSGDRIELILPMPLELKAADEQHRDLVALCCGPLVLFAIGDGLPQLDRRTLLAARQPAPAAVEWRSGPIRFLPWWVIGNETYTTYHEVT